MQQKQQQLHINADLKLLQLFYINNSRTIHAYLHKQTNQKNKPKNNKIL